MILSDREIEALVVKHGLDLGMYPPPTQWVLVDNGDGTLSFKRPNTLTSYGEKLMAFARDIINHTHEIRF